MGKLITAKVRFRLDGVGGIFLSVAFENKQNGKKKFLELRKLGKDFQIIWKNECNTKSVDDDFTE
ncbi:CLUMA_CG017358, isoform A [Clunio marinus]|uniref:CLUMA_CG017358, isoform A n=1 Tax=Clunio marinus TaxID=568069 RepID=A0A1J1IVG6_9DIPT|nr:CLUMA_CG017358, isoform A [Clunio marinus]